MAYRFRAVAILFVSFVFAGCNASETPHVAGSSPDSAEVSVDLAVNSVPGTATLPASTTAPGSVVQAFLLALRDGDDDVAAGLLTNKAREETAKHDLVVEPPGTPNAEFFVGEIEYVDANKQGAHVKSVWSEAASGSEISYEIVWALRQQPDGWRIAGMATEIIEGQRPVFLNFEDPSDMLEKWQRAEEIASRHQETTRQEGPIRR